MKNGQKLIRHWVSTAKKDCWTDEYKDRQRAWMKNYMANGKGTRFSVFTTRIRCALCGSSFGGAKRSMTGLFIGDAAKAANVNRSASGKMT